MWLKNNTYMARLFTAVIMALLLFGCGGGGSSSTPPPVYTITGTIVDNTGIGIPGVKVTLTPTAVGKSVAIVSAVTMETDASGVYAFTNVTAGNYTVGSNNDTKYGFIPKSLTVSSATTVSQIPAYLVYSITGKIDNAPAGVTVSVVGTSPAVSKSVITTSATGEYEITGLPSGSYTVTPLLAGYDFTAASINLVITDTNKTGQNFNASLRTYAITGKIIDNTIAGVAIAGVKVSASSALSTVTDSTGSFTFNVAPGTYTLYSTDQKYTFNQQNVVVTVTASGKNIPNIIAVPTFTVPVFSISGTITRMDVAPSELFAGVAVKLYKITYTTDSFGKIYYLIDGLYGANGITRDLVETATSTTNASGAYTFTGVPAGHYSIIPGLSGFVFNPDKIEVMSISTDGKLYKFDPTLTGNHITLDGQIIYNSGPYVITDNNVAGQNFNASIPGGVPAGS